MLKLITYYLLLITLKNVKKLVNRPGYRLRVGDWRIIYEIDAEKLRILVLEIDTRGGIYQ